MINDPLDLDDKRLPMHTDVVDAMLSSLPGSGNTDKTAVRKYLKTAQMIVTKNDGDGSRLVLSSDIT